jgi:hypothetical protein
MDNFLVDERAVENNGARFHGNLMETQWKTVAR